MSDIKCPFCNETELEKGIKLQNGGCMLGCPKCKLVAPNIFWQELIRTRKALDVAVDALKSAKTRLELINNSKFANLNNVLQIQSQCEVLKINKALEQITALEQKDIK